MEDPAAGASEDIEARLRGIVDSMNAGRGVPAVSSQSDLFFEGYIDSFALFDLIARVERDFSIRFADKDLTKANFATVSALSRVVAAKARPG